MNNLSPEVQMAIIAGAGFFLGWLITWLVVRSGRKGDARGYESQLQAAQSSLKRTQDDLQTVQSQLDSQRARAEELAADKANVQNSLKQVEEAQAGTDARISDLEATLEQEVQRREVAEETLGNEVERREAAEEMLEQVRAQAMELQTALDASEIELADLGVRINNEAEARSAAEIALEAETARVAELADELEALYEELALAKREAEAAKGREQVAMRSPAGTAPVVAVAAGAAVQRDEDEDGELAELEEAQKQVAELSESVNVLSAMGAELSAELEKRTQENKLLRAQLAALEPQQADDLATDAEEDQEAELAALRNELSSALAQNEKLEQLLAAAQADMEDTRLALDSAQQAADISSADLATRSESLSAEVAATTEALRQKDAELSQAAARVGELETALAAATQQSESLTAQIEALRSERDALTHDKTGMEARLQDRTEEVNALTTATVTAAATIKRRDEALQRAGAQIETLHTQMAEAEAAKTAAEAALAEKDASVAQVQSELASLRAELDALMEAKTSTDTALAEAKANADVALAETAAALAEKGSAAEALETQLQEARAQSEVVQAQLAARTERLTRLTALVQTVTAGEAGISRTPSKTAAVRSALALGVTPGELLRPQDFDPLSGIGAAYEQRLYAAGVGTYWELANIADEDLLRALGLERLQQLRVQPSVIRAEAYKLAEETGTVGLVWEGRKIDDFEPLEGVGEVFEQRLYSAGIYTYEDLASATVEQLAGLIESTRQATPDFAHWIAQAKELLAKRGTARV